VTISFSAGYINKTNRTETVTATVVDTSVTAQIPIQVIGSTMTLTPSKTSILVGSSITLTANVKNASKTGIAAQSIRFSIPAGNGALSGGTVGTGSATAQTVTTASSGDTSAVTFTPSIAGSVVVTADWLDSNGNVSQTTDTTITVTSVGIPFAFTSSPPQPFYLGTSQPITVSVPSSITMPMSATATPVANVRFATTLGTWSTGAKTSIIAPTANAATEILTSGISSGIANIQVDALGAIDPLYPSNPPTVLATLNLVVPMSATFAGTITLQPSVSNVAPSTAGTSNSATLTATVRDAPGGNTVSGAAVLFEIMNPTGSGEQISPVVAMTDNAGQAVATFTSGSASTVGGIKIKASVLGTAANCDDSVTPKLPGICDVKSIFVGGTGVSVSIGRANTISSVDGNADYQLPMSVLIVDNSGAAVPNVLVTLSAFPTFYYKGVRAADCSPIYAVGFPKPNEDVNENDNLDPGEDLNGDGLITPPHATAGTVPSTVTTDKNGVATFNLIYQKTYASWIRTRVRAKVVIVTGTTESTNELQFVLPYLITDATPCTLPNSPPSFF
jgi:hypothetical protein